MAYEDIKAELESLRAEVAALAAARKQAAEAVAIHEEPAPELAKVPVADTGHEGFKGHVEDLIELLEHEVKESPVIAGVAVFALGVLVGRLSR
ncbi:MAG: hypothetical protein AAGF92_03860 [Myxococcota bacterium]